MRSNLPPTHNFWLRHCSIPRNVRLSHRQIVTFSAHRDFFDYCGIQIFLLTYLLADEFILLINIYGSFIEKHVQTT